MYDAIGKRRVPDVPAACRQVHGPEKLADQGNMEETYGGQKVAAAVSSSASSVWASWNALSRTKDHLF